MQGYLTLTRRELGAFFVSITGYVIIAAAAFLMGLSFVDLLAQLREDPTPVPVTQLFFATPYFWFILLLGAPVITMRLFSLEKASGTYETLMTAPVGDLQVVLAKFTAAMVFYLLMWLPLLACILIVRHYTTQPAALDAWLLGSAFIGILLLGGLLMSLGCLASALTRSQILAAMLTLTAGFTFFLLSFFAEQMAANSTWQAEVLSHLALIDQMNDFARGLIDTRHVVLLLSLAFIGLFLTLRALETRRWK